MLNGPLISLMLYLVENDSWWLVIARKVMPRNLWFPELVLKETIKFCHVCKLDIRGEEVIIQKKWGLHSIYGWYVFSWGNFG